METVKLLPCPFCGGEADTKSDDWVFCSECGVGYERLGDYGPGLVELAALWNTRANSSGIERHLVAIETIIIKWKEELDTGSGAALTDTVTGATAQIREELRKWIATGESGPAR